MPVYQSSLVHSSVRPVARARLYPLARTACTYVCREHAKREPCLSEREFLSLSLCLSVCSLPDWKQVGEASEQRLTEPRFPREQKRVYVVGSGRGSQSCACQCSCSSRRAVRFVAFAGSLRFHRRRLAPTFGEQNLVRKRKPFYAVQANSRAKWRLIRRANDAPLVPVTLECEKVSSDSFAVPVRSFFRIGTRNGKRGISWRNDRAGTRVPARVRRGRNRGSRLKGRYGVKGSPRGAKITLKRCIRLATRTCALPSTIALCPDIVVIFLRFLSNDAVSCFLRGALTPTVRKIFALLSLLRVSTEA
nr:PREDICTED: uncharacterized protein LOC105661998 isoform X1 [Megachile rotundata]XP_012136706.1 PREDICTED: uncharacterized protein LOC105661998 isoform X2 [Megachile rotundata]